MASLSSFLGVNGGPTTPNLAPYHTIFHVVFAYAVLSSRPIKGYLKIDHNVSPREDVIKYGESAVKEGKITQRQLNFVKRNEGCHANAIEGFPIFAAAVVFATIAKVDNEKINWLCATYTASRIVFAVLYLSVEKSVGLSYLRSIAWWSGNIACFRLLSAAGYALNNLI